MLKRIEKRKASEQEEDAPEPNIDINDQKKQRKGTEVAETRTVTTTEGNPGIDLGA